MYIYICIYIIYIHTYTHIYMPMVVYMQNPDQQWLPMLIWILADPGDLSALRVSAMDWIGISRWAWTFGTSKENRATRVMKWEILILEVTIGVALFLFAPCYHSYERDQCRTVRLFLSWVSTKQQGTRMKPVRLSCAEYSTQIMCGSQDIGPVYQNMSSMSLFCDPRVANCAACSNVKPYPISQLCGGYVFGKCSDGFRDLQEWSWGYDTVVLILYLLLARTFLDISHKKSWNYHASGFLKSG